jgi:glycyl-tRNA synthetase alpha subunit
MGIEFKRLGIQVTIGIELINEYIELIDSIGQLDYRAIRQVFIRIELG